MGPRVWYGSIVICVGFADQVVGSSLPRSSNARLCRVIRVVGSGYVYPWRLVGVAKLESGGGTSCL